MNETALAVVEVTPTLPCGKTICRTRDIRGVSQGTPRTGMGDVNAHSCNDEEPPTLYLG
jgi:hypothetical protein